MIGSTASTFATAVVEPFRDAWLGARARLATLMAAGTDAGAVSVEAYRGSVVLAGVVATSTTRDAILRAVRNVSGVVGVDDRLRVRDQQSRRAAGSDAETRFQVTTALRRDARFRATTIHLASVYDGVVTLAGSAPSAAVADAAFDLVMHLPGVRRVMSDVAIPHNADVGTDADAA